MNHGLTCKLKRRIRAMNSDTAENNPLSLDSRRDETEVRSATAAHQADFPYDRDEEAQVTRREFCNFLGLTSAALLVGATGFAAKAALDAGESQTFLPAQIEGAAAMSPGSSLNFRYPTERDTAILIRSLDGTYHAFGQKCTHLSCPVYFDRGHQRLECPAMTVRSMLAPETSCMDRHRDLSMWSVLRFEAMVKFGQWVELRAAERNRFEA